MNSRTIFLFAATSILAIGLIAYWHQRLNPHPRPFEPAPVDVTRISPSDLKRLMDETVSKEASAAAMLRDLTQLLQRRLQRSDARANEAVLTFASAEAMKEFLARAARSGLQVVGRIDSLNTIRIRYENLDGLARELLENSSDYNQVAANYLIGAPATPPVAQDRAARLQIPVRNQLLNLLGISGESSTFGRGVTIAVLDSGVVADATFGTGRVTALDIGLGTSPGSGGSDGHGTAVAALAAGMAPDARGVAPAANILSVRVTSDNGTSDTFTLAQGILAAVDAGARILNISLGGYGTNAALNQAIDYAIGRGAVLVAAAGNDQAAQLTWPAADPRVISVGAVDANSQQVLFSNSGAQLQVTAPGYGVQTAWANGSRVYFDGTSASAPVVAGAIAAVISQEPSLSPTAAWQVLKQHSSEAGVPGADPDYGSGVLNVGWALARNNPTRADTAVASQYFNASAEQVQFVLQNRSAQGVAGLTLNITVNGAPRTYPVSWLPAGATQVINLPLSLSQLTAAREIEVRAELVNPSSVTDQVPANNQRATLLVSPAAR